jgi:hypothetical protein
MAKLLSSLTVVIVARDECPNAAMLDRIARGVDEFVVDLNIVIIANGADSNLALKLKELVEAEPDLTVTFLGVRQQDDVARLVGLDQAVGDYILLCTPTDAEVDNLPRILAPLAAGYDLVVGAGAGGVEADRSFVAGLLFSTFRRLFRGITGTAFEERPTGLRVFSRAAALHVAGHVAGEVFVRARVIGAGFPSMVVELPASPIVKKRGVKTSAGLRHGLRLLLTTTALPLRMCSLVGFAAGLLSLVYAVYVIFIYFVMRDVQRGWTTLSLQISGMMFIFSVMFVFLAEYLIQILSASRTRSRRNFVVREITSQSSRRSRRWNIVDASGEFQLGAPQRLVGETTKSSTP